MSEPVIRWLAHQEERVETGPTQFGKDWPGLFIRGDNCAGYRLALEALLDENHSEFDLVQLRGFLELLAATEVKPHPTPQEGGEK